MDIGEVVRLLRAGESDSTISALVGHNRRTVARYRRWAQEQGLLTGELPGTAELHRLVQTSWPRRLPPQQVSSLAPYREEVRAYRELGLEMAAIRCRLEERHGHPVSYSAVRRLVAHLEPAPVAAVTRVEVAPGSEAQVDFGYAGLCLDPQSGRPRKAWVFSMVLSWSRHQYAEVVWDQGVQTWLLCHRHAFEFFGGYMRNCQDPAEWTCWRWHHSASGRVLSGCARPRGSRPLNPGCGCGDHVPHQSGWPWPRSGTWSSSPPDKSALQASRLRAVQEGCGDRLEPVVGDRGRAAQVNLAQTTAHVPVRRPVGATALAALLAHGEEAVDVAVGRVVDGVGEAGGGRRLQPGKPGGRVEP
ncbi:MAG TPA: hypothetical protein VFE42_32895 [Chloroflexota bacterium]|nr:hypothetical protein [Chloroflexota bacterium]